MVFLAFSPYIIISSFITTLLLDRGVSVAGNRQFPISSPWYPKANPPKVAKTFSDETEALKKVLPLVTFDCRGKTGYFPDSKFNCEVFHYCQPDGGRSTFHCPAHQLFNQLSMVCEGKTVHNSKLCREGSINPSKLQKHSNTKKINSSEKITPIFKPSLNSSSSKDKKLMTLEDLLTYMNSEKGSRDSEPTFVSRFHKAEASQKSPKLSESAISIPKKEARPVEDKKHSKLIDVRLKAESSDHSVKVTKSSSISEDDSKRNGEKDEVSAEYDAIEGRKIRKHKRVGRVLDIETERQPKKEKERKPHSRMTERSVSEPPQPQEITTSAGDTDSRNSSSPSLFQTDRNKARDIRKRKRYQGRKRKTTTTPGTVLETETELEASVTTTMPILSTIRQDFDAPRNNAYKRRKSQRTRTRSDIHKVPKSEKIEPYTLPPLPIPEEGKQETTTQSMQREEEKTKNPWHKPTLPPTDEDVKFGEKISDLDLHHYQTDTKLRNDQDSATDFFGVKDIPNASEELLSEEYRERFSMQSKHSEEMPSRSKSKVKNLQKYNEDDGYKYEPYSQKHPEIAPANIFPPPRAEPREHHSTPSQQMMLDYESHLEKGKSYSFSKTTTEDPFKITHPYRDQYQIGIQGIKDQENERWKTNLDKVKSDEKKVEVGSTFFFQNPASPNPTQKPELHMIPPTESSALESIHKEKDMPKHTLAQQHLSKLMNDFFAMSSPKIPGRLKIDSDKEDVIVPEYRIPDEDIYTGSESVAEDVEEIPPELLEVVDLITGNVEKEKKNQKPRTSHEIIKINGPLTNSHIEKIFLDDKFDAETNQQPESSDGSFKKIVVIPRPEDKEDSRDTEVEEITSLKLEHFLKQYADKKTLKPLKVIPLKPEPQIKHQPTILRAKKIPVRIIYRDQLTEKLQPKPINPNPNVKIIRTHISSSPVKITPDRKKQGGRTIGHEFASYSQPQIILHPSSLFPPHPPPLPKKQYSLNARYPFVSNPRFHVQNMRQAHSRRRRSIANRLRRQIRQNQYFLPFSGPTYPSFNPKFIPTFSPFKPLFNPASLHTSGSHLNPFAFPGYPIPKSPQNGPRSFRPSHPRPPPVRHISPSGHQTVIVEEVPVPVPVEVPSANLLQPAPSGSPPSKLPPRYQDNQFRNPSPPAIQTPPLIQRPQHGFPPPPNNYQPFGMPSNIRPPPPVNYHSPIPLTGPLPPRITSEGQLFALGVTNKPILTPSDPRPALPPSRGPNPPPRNPPTPYNPFNVHANGYPNFPYFQGAFTTPISNAPVAGRLMYSGYKPPKSTIGTKPPKQTVKSKDHKATESNSNRSRSKPRQEYFDVPPRPMRESHVSYTEEVLSGGRSRERPNLEEYSTNHKDLNFPRQNSHNNPPSNELPRRRRPGRRRRPRPYTTTTQGSSFSNDISPTPPPPEQIPPPPAEYTSKPSHQEVLSSLPSSSEGTRIHETSSHFPPAGYYGKDQLVQFFDASSKPNQKNVNLKPPHHRHLGESRSNIESDRSIASTSIEDGNEPAFGTRLRSKPQTESRHRQSKNNQPPRSQTQKSEIRARPNNKHTEIIEEKQKERPTNEDNKPQMQIKNERPPPRRRRPPPPRDRNRPPPMLRPQSEGRPQPEGHHFKYNEDMSNFYSVPKGLQNLVAPENTQQGLRGSTDMFGLPHPIIDQSIYSLRPQGAPVDFNPNFFSVPHHVAQQQQSPLHKMNVRPIPESHRDFFTAPETGSIPAPENNESDKKESESRHAPSKSKGENDEHQEPPMRKLRKPKRKNRYNPHSTESRDSSEMNNIKSQGDPREGSTVRYREKPMTTATTAEPHSTTPINYQRPITTLNYQSQNDIKESQNLFKQRSPLLPKALPELSKSLMNGKIDIQKLNATISTSVSVSGAIPQTNNTNSEEKENKKVFSSQNGGGLAVVRKGPKRKRARQRVSSTTGVPYVNNESNTDAKYEIAASVLDIIKATTETERQGSGHHDSFQSERPSSSRVSNIWVENPSNNKYQT